jgi:CBS domain-containing protein
MRCEEIMKADVECCSPRDTVYDAACRMRDENVGFLPICDQSRKVLGTLTDRDICVRLVAGEKSGDTLIEEIMTREVVTCSPEDDVGAAEAMMAENHKSRMMICDRDGRLVGVISLSDLAQLDSERVSETLRQVSEREARV